MKKKLLAFLITCVMITGVISTNYMNTHALSAGATYTAYEIISMIFAVVGGTTIQQNQGLLGGSSFNANSLYETMNNQSAGIGSLLSSYVNRAQYLSPGSDLILSDADYQAFLQYFHDYNIASNASGQIDSANETEFLQKASEFTGVTISSLRSSVRTKINSGEFKYLLTGTYESGGWFYIYGGDFVINDTPNGNQELQFSENYAFYTQNYGLSHDRSSGLTVVFVPGTLRYTYLIGGTGYKNNTVANGKIKNGTYDTVSKSRTWDATQGKLVGNTTITMPATETLDEAINAENVKDITDAVNVYPVDTADDSMLYYPTQSVPDFIVPTITVNPAITFPGIDGGISDYTIELRNFFPFCIPWDIYDMLSAFVTTPETPEFTFRFPTGVINHQIQWTDCTFDLHAWDGVAQGLRTLELIAFAVGLALMTRNIFLRG